MVTTSGLALPDTRVYLQGPPGPVLVARSDARGRFSASGLCLDPSTATTLSAHRAGFAPGLAPIVTNTSGAAVAHLRLQRLGEKDRG